MRFSSRIPFGSGSSGSTNRLTALLDEKRRAGGPPVLDLTISNPTLAGFVYPDDVLASLAAPAALVHEPSPLGLPVARAAVAADHARRGFTVDPADVALTASTSEAYALLFKLLADPGDTILAPTPGYPLFGHLAALEGLRLEHYPLVWDGEWHLDAGAVAAAVTPRTRAILVVSPGNPTGAYLKRGELARLGELGLPLIVDEVFAEYPTARAPGDRVELAAAAEIPVPVFSLGGLSKSVGLPQLKLAWILASRAARPALPRLEIIADAYLSVGTPVMHAAAHLLSAGAAVREAIRARVAAGRAALEGSPLELLPAEGGWSAILRLPRVRDDEEWALALLDEHGVLVHPGYFYDLDGGPYVVVSLLAPAEDLLRGAGAILALCPRDFASR